MEKVFFFHTKLLFQDRATCVKINPEYPYNLVNYNALVNFSEIIF